MKLKLLVATLVFVSTIHAQAKDEQKLHALTYRLSHTVFGTKDSSMLEKLFAAHLSYGHSKGKIENRKEAINGIVKNKSVYKDTSVSNVTVTVQNNVAVVRHLFIAKEHKPDGTVAALNFTMVLVWIKEGKKWKLLARQAVALSQ